MTSAAQRSLEALVLAAGAGTRLRPLTASRPKPLVDFLGRPIVEFILDRIADAGVDLITVWVDADNHSQQIVNHLGNEWSGVPIHFIDVSCDIGTAGILTKLPQTEANTDLLVVVADVISTLDITGFVAAHRRSGLRDTSATPHPRRVSRTPVSARMREDERCTLPGHRASAS